MGAPPRVRGEVPLHRRYQTRLGRTPARAGRSQCGPGRRCPRWAHPRACGEKRIRRGSRCLTIGAPPRVRGEACPLTTCGRLRRRTPARAGRSWTPAPPSSTRSAHPRACGEKYWGPACVIGAVGAPPRVRGEVESARVSRACGGRTPARAGRRCRAAESRPARWAHPRACGEKVLLGSHDPEADGAPPRVRGEAGALNDTISVKRRTPARAGRRHDSFRDLGYLSGAPPRVRGEDLQPSASRALVRRTPARAGRRATCSTLGSTGPAHPRACGEKMVGVWVPQMREGAPPRVRGEDLLARGDG